MDNQPKRSVLGRIVRWIFMFLLISSLVISVMLNIGLGTALYATGKSFYHSDTDEPVDEFPSFEEEWSYGSGTAKVVRLDLFGIITREMESGLFEVPVDRVEEMIRAIRAARHDEEVRAIIIDVDSPGGGITPSDEIYRELMLFKESAEGRKVVIYMRDLAASGGYYVAMAGDWLVAQPTTVLGSIGVIMQSLNWKGLSDKIGVTDTTIKSGDNKDLLNPFRESDPEQIAMLQDMIDRMHTRFRALVSAGRGIEEARLMELADGRIFTADQALELNLIDQVGYWEDVMDKTAELLGEEDIKVVRYYQTMSFFDFLSGVRHPLAAPLAKLNEAPRLQYLWKP